MSLSVGARLGRYEVRSLLGAGGMGEVYLAQDTKLDRTAALKVLPTDVASDQERMRRFVQEAKAASAIKHPNVATIYEIGEAEGTTFIAMEHVEGQPLDAKINGRPIGSAEAVEIASQVADALDEAHLKGITHRDIKSANIMITPRGQVKVLDFGLAKVAAHKPQPTKSDMATVRKTDPGVVMGTVQYMSPEQALGREVDHRTDIFSLGVVMYEMATGRLPFAGATASETIDKITHSQPEAIARLNYEVPAELERIIRKCLEKDRERRYSSARELLIDLKNLKRDSDSGSAATDEIAARPWSHSRRIALVAIASAILGITVAVIIYMAGGSKTTTDSAAIDSIAVLPFINANADPNTDYLSDGITESIINSLSQLPHLKVMSRNSVFRYKGREADAQAVAKELKVQAVLTGRVTQRGDGLSISVELINAQDNSQIWGQQYNRKLADVFAVQQEIAGAISEKLRLKLTGTERQQLAKRPTENLKAFQYYMQGRAYTQRRTREDLLTAIRYCEKAIEEDRNYALAYAGLADVYDNLGLRGYIAPIEGRRKAEEMARKALALDDNLAEAHAVLGQAYIDFAPYNFSLGDGELRRAIELSASLAMAHQYLGVSLARQGRLDEGLEEFLKARELDPLSSIIARNVAVPYYFKRDYVRAFELLRQANELGPGSSTHWEIGIYIQNRLFDEALAELEKAKRERKSDPILIYSTGMVYAAQGKRAEALQIIKELEEMSGANLDEAHWIAKIYAALNEKEQAFSWLERGLATGAIGAFYKDEPVWDTIRSDPRFADLLRQMGIP
jgi:serine/threonine protein kinase/Flp pilus assembly protein TadD